MLWPGKAQGGGGSSQVFLAGSFPPDFQPLLLLPATRCWHVPVPPRGAEGTQSTIPVSPSSAPEVVLRSPRARSASGHRLSKPPAGEKETDEDQEQPGLIWAVGFTELAKVQAGRAATVCPGCSPTTPSRAPGSHRDFANGSQNEPGKGRSSSGAAAVCPITLPLNISGQLGTRSISPCCFPTSCAHLPLGPKSMCVCVGNSRDFTSLYPNLSL